MNEHKLKAIPQRINIKQNFENHYKKFLGEKYELFIKYSSSYINKAIRVNTLKISVDEVKSRLEKRWILKQIPWCKEGFWINYRINSSEENERFDIGNLIEHNLGYIYVQEASSMIPPVVLNPKPGEIVLDMCAAPGSKASQIAQYMKNKGVLICNDIQGSRLKPLGMNLQRCGVSNSIITMMKSKDFLNSNILYDKILVDAPCSGTGTIRKSLKTLIMWSPNLIERLVKTQKQLVDTAFQILKPGGILVYSTCTLEPEENESVVSFLLDKYTNAIIKKINFKGNRTNPITQFDGLKIRPEVKDCLRIHPYDNNSEGFFVAKIQKH
ncbi:MAG: NOL1/NOP2/sun family putative RNA methylase [Candidatus Woesearchaeota archaeon]